LWVAKYYAHGVYLFAVPLLDGNFSMVRIKTQESTLFEAHIKFEK